MNILLVVFCILVVGCIATDPRNITSGTTIATAPLGYFDQPQIVVCPVTGVWVCVMTNNMNGREGAPGEHISSSFSSDNGTTWSPLLEIEPPSSIAASYASTFITPKGRIYTVYTYNADNITTFPDGKPLDRTDQMGHFKLKYSDDCGQSWSSERYEVPVRVTNIDKANNWNGSVLMFWTVSKPIIVENSVIIAFTKIGQYFMNPPEEIWFLRSDNALNATDASTITWVTLPDGEVGINPPPGPGIAEESHVVELDSPNRLWVTYRTNLGYMGGGYSMDSGETWTTMWTTYEGGPYGRPLKNPRAPIAAQKLSNGMYLFLYFNNNATNWSGRNPYWLAAGRLVNGTVPSIEISQPEIILYVTEHDTNGSPAYPDIVEINGGFYITEADKGGPVASVRVSQINPSILNLMFNQWELNSPISGYVVNEVSPAPASQFSIPAFANVASGDGFTIVLWISLPLNAPGNASILDTRNTSATGSPGVLISTGPYSSLGITISDGSQTASQFSDNTCGNVLLDGLPHQVAFVVDGGPKIISIVIDDILCDGGLEFQMGWSFFSLTMNDVTGADVASVGSAAKLGQVLVYNRYLMNSEIISNWRAGIQ